MIVRSADAGRRPAEAEPGHDLPEERVARDAPWCPGVGGEQPPEVAQPGGAEQRVRHGVERHVPVGVAVQPRGTGDLHPAQPEGRSRAEGVAVVAEAGARQDGAEGGRERLLDQAQVVGLRHLEVRGFARDRMDRDVTGLEQRRLVRELPRSLRREQLPGVEQQAPPGALRRLGRGEHRAVHRLVHHAISHPLEGLGHRHHGDRRPVADDRRGHGLHECRRDERARPVVDQDRAVASGRVDVVQVPDARRDRDLARGTTGHHGVDSGGQPGGRGEGVHALRRGHQDEAPHDGRRGERSRGSRREAGGPRPGPAACRCRPCAGTSRRRPPRRPPWRARRSRSPPQSR